MTMIINDTEYLIRNLIKFNVNGQTVVLPRRYIVDGLMKHLMMDLIDYHIGDELTISIFNYNINVKDVCDQISKCIALKIKLPIHFTYILRDLYYSFAKYVRNDKMNFKYLYDKYRMEYRIRIDEEDDFKWCLHYTIDELNRDQFQGYDSLVANVNTKWNSIRNTNITIGDDKVAKINECTQQSKPPLPPASKQTTVTNGVNLSPVPRPPSQRTNPTTQANRNSLPIVNIIHPLRPIATKRSMVQCPLTRDLSTDDIDQYVTFFGKSYRVRDMQTLPNGSLIPKHALIDAIITSATAKLPQTYNPNMEYNISFKAVHKGVSIDVTNNYDVVVDQYRPKQPLSREHIEVIIRIYRLLTINPDIEEDSLTDMILDGYSIYDRDDITFCIKCTYHAYFEHERVQLVSLIEHVNDDYNLHRDDVLKFDPQSNSYVVDLENDILPLAEISKMIRLVS